MPDEPLHGYCLLCSGPIQKGDQWERADGLVHKTCPEPDKPFTLTINGQEVRTWLEWTWLSGWDMYAARENSIRFYPNQNSVRLDRADRTADDFLHLADDLRAIRSALGVAE